MAKAGSSKEKAAKTGFAREADLYPPIKTYLEAQGYEVKAEIGAVDVVAIRGEEPPVLVEIKRGFTLSLLHQGVARLAISDDVYLAIPRGKGKAFLTALKGHKTLCRRLGLGLITVRPRDNFVEVHLDPGPYTPRKSKLRQGRLLREFARRVGDPNAGGQTRSGIVTAYRQDALKVAAYLAATGPSKGAHVAKATGVETATRLMADDHYGWFERVEKGIYALTPKGEAERGAFEGALPTATPSA
ncbi:DUF2161 family putative PD-(D/E)XK-type phosphodiesterase [Halocynthiibacter sp. C4]|uniref:DUF2161 domain-containing phosphodiesterase n=1 Tax=Halocynthiibacter sp. C4 TaxID=2992758 RepID=UPI00237A7D84|nr:DUF2161 family putative PD-(D/E)XK-type phosphodiesterase [Halocynthiibacter sp. C4]MDE0590283.1 DUF2161 family putative PD-(D/E)XK-type phosphodiesterase [Halocynthiibacter sp. C4]